jgi:hypothetical protein
MKKDFNIRLVLVRTHNGDRPVGTFLKEVHPEGPPTIEKTTYITLTEPAQKGSYRVRYRRIHFVCGCIGSRADGPKRFIPTNEDQQ